MNWTILELNDSEITIVRAGKILARSPGVAVIRDGHIELGEKAARMAHLDPRHTFNRFWRDLQQAQLPIATDHARHHADLAFAHLLSLHEAAGKPKEVVFAVPGSFTTEQLSLLLGLVEASPFAMTGLIDSAVAATASRAAGGHYQHVDIHLHRAVITTLSVSAYVERTGVKVIDGAGIVAIHDKCAAFIADLFIQQVRLDPLHQARTEQALYDQLPACLRDLQHRNEALIEIQFENSRYQVRLLRDSLVKTLEPLYGRLFDAIDRSTNCLLSHRAAALPAFSERLPGCRTLDAMAVFNGCMQYAPPPRSEEPGISFVTRLKAPAGAANTEPAVASVRNVGGQITHVLIGNTAYPLSGIPIYVTARATVSMEKQPDSLCSLMLADGGASLRIEGGVPADINGRRIAHAAALMPGDAVSFSGTDLVLRNIKVVDMNAAK